MGFRGSRVRIPPSRLERASHLARPFCVGPPASRSSALALRLGPSGQLHRGAEVPGDHHSQPLGDVSGPKAYLKCRPMVWSASKGRLTLFALVYLPATISPPLDLPLAESPGSSHR